MSSKGSFHLYLSDDESELARQAAEIINTSQAYVVRLMLRKFLELPLGDEGEANWDRLVECGIIVNP